MHVFKVSCGQKSQYGSHKNLWTVYNFSAD
jgi:hypothetical protein